jgi:hypothetical protein
MPNTPTVPPLSEKAAEAIAAAVMTRNNRAAANLIVSIRDETLRITVHRLALEFGKALYQEKAKAAPAPAPEAAAPEPPGRTRGTPLGEVRGEVVLTAVPPVPPTPQAEPYDPSSAPPLVHKLPKNGNGKAKAEPPASKADASGVTEPAPAADATGSAAPATAKGQA